MTDSDLTLTFLRALVANPGDNPEITGENYRLTALDPDHLSPTERAVYESAMLMNRSFGPPTTHLLQQSFTPGDGPHLLLSELSARRQPTTPEFRWTQTRITERKLSEHLKRAVEETTAALNPDREGSLRDALSKTLTDVSLLQGRLQQDEAAAVENDAAASFLRQEYLTRLQQPALSYGQIMGISNIDDATHGGQLGELWLVAGFVGHGKCTAATARILDLTTGQLRTIQELYDEYRTHGTRPIIYAIDPKTKKPTTARIERIWPTGNKPIVSFKLDGREQRTSADHKFLTPNGWTRAEDLNDGDQVYVPNTLPKQEHRGTPTPPETTYTNAVLKYQRTVDGVSLLSDIPDADLSTTTAALTQAGIEYQLYPQPHTQGLYHKLRISTKGVTPKEEDPILLTPSENRHRYVTALWQTRGHIALDPQARETIFSLDLDPNQTEETNLVLLTLGIRTILGAPVNRLDRNAHSTVTRRLHRLTIHPDSARDFYALINKATRQLPAPLPRPKHRVLRGLATVTNKVLLPEEPTFDYEVPGPANALVDGAWQHNSTLMLNWAHFLATQGGFNVLFASLEMPPKQVWRVLGTIHSAHPRFSRPPLDYRQIKSASLSPDDQRFYMEEVLPDLETNSDYGRIHVYKPQQGLDLDQLQTYMSIIHRRSPLDAAFVDYAGIMSPRKGSKGRARSDTVNENITGLKQMALTFDGGHGILVVSGHQTNRAGVAEAAKVGGVYTLAALADANSAERDSDVVLTVYQDDAMKQAEEAMICNLKTRDSHTVAPFKVYANQKSRIIGELRTTSSGHASAAAESLDDLLH